MELTATDAGQGDSLFIRFPDGKSMVLDGGGIPAVGHQTRSQLDMGEDDVAPYLWNRSIRTVDVIALSHAHEDHAGGLPALIEDFHPREIWTGTVPPSPVWKLICEKAAKAGARIVPLDEGSRLALGGAQIEVLAPPSGYVPADTPKNNDSLVLRLRYGRHTFLLSGDVERPIEQRMLEDGELSRTDVLKVAHHGSKTSSSDAFLDAVQPMFAVISVGQDNTYGHPKSRRPRAPPRTPRRHLPYRRRRPDQHPKRWPPPRSRNRPLAPPYAATLGSILNSKLDKIASDFCLLASLAKAFPLAIRYEL